MAWGDRPLAASPQIQQNVWGDKSVAAENFQKFFK
jgi:hypothetical protein